MVVQPDLALRAVEDAFGHVQVGRELCAAGELFGHLHNGACQLVGLLLGRGLPCGQGGGAPPACRLVEVCWGSKLLMLQLCSGTQIRVASGRLAYLEALCLQASICRLA